MTGKRDNLSHISDKWTFKLYQRKKGTVSKVIKIRSASSEDLPRLMEIFDAARAYQISHGNATQWPEGYPSQQTVTQDILEEFCYVLEEDERVVATFALIPGKEPTYQFIENGRWISETPYCTIHRVASDGTGRGIGQMIMEWCLQRCQHIRIDTHRDNLVMRHLIEKNGFTYCGVIYVEDGTPRMAYEFADEDIHKKIYQFWGWENANAPAITDEYKGIKTPIDLYNALSDIWCAETCAPRMRDDWTKENKTLGQCSITAFLAQDIFGGKVYGILRPGGNYHCYNVIGDCRFDLTSEQFGNEILDYENNPEQLRVVHFAKEEKRLRYEYLKSELKKYTEVQ